MNLQVLCEFILGTCHEDLKFPALRPLVTLSRSLAVDFLYNEKGTSILFHRLLKVEHLSASELV